MLLYNNQHSGDCYNVRQFLFRLLPRNCWGPSGAAGRGPSGHHVDLTVRPDAERELVAAPTPGTTASSSTSIEVAQPLRKRHGGACRRGGRPWARGLGSGGAEHRRPKTAARPSQPPLGCGGRPSPNALAPGLPAPPQARDRSSRSPGGRSRPTRGRRTRKADQGRCHCAQTALARPAPPFSRWRSPDLGLPGTKRRQRRLAKPREKVASGLAFAVLGEVPKHFLVPLAGSTTKAMPGQHRAERGLDAVIAAFHTSARRAVNLARLRRGSSCCSGAGLPFHDPSWSLVTLSGG
jgi:hypothetical protein